MTPDENAEDLAMHAEHFAQRIGFTYTVLDLTGDVIGCVYIDPGRQGADADIRSSVRANRPILTGRYGREVLAWIRREWPFRNVSFAGLG